MKRLFVVSNRLPISIEHVEDKFSVRPSSGGLVSAVDSYLNGKGQGQFDEVYWAGVAGCSERVWKRLLHPDETPYTMLPIFAERKTYDGYYNGFSNSCLWPLFHYFPSISEFSLNHFTAYVEMNQQFANKLAAQCTREDVVWIHDYHLLLLPEMLRKLVPGITIGFFLHIPFPSFEILRLMPRKWQASLLKGMLGADLIGFHTIDYSRHFLESVRAVLKLEPDGPLVSFESRKVRAEVFPIGIDFEKFHDAYDRPEIARQRAALRKEFQDKKFIFSVDRLDYTKGVSHRLRAYEYFLTHHPEYHGKVVFSIVIVPSRDTISKYAERKKMIDEFIGNLNSRFGTMFWQPVIYHYNHLTFEELLAMYTSCDMALITPLRDGMNLVCKEFVASRKDGQGVLILSDMTGAARELEDALIINPNDTEEIADCILQGLEMDAEEQARRMRAMQERVKSYNVSVWAADFFRQLQDIKSLQLEFEYKFLDADSQMRLLEDYRQADKRLLLLDYDGTLVPFSAQPAQAAPQHALLELLASLTSDARNHVYIISGRDSSTLERWLGHLPLNLIAEHGSKLKVVKGEWATEISIDAAWHKDVETMMEDYVVRCPRSFIERKEFSIAWHYRNADSVQGALRAKELAAELQAIAQGKNLHVLNGHKVVEVRSKGIDKGTAVAKLLEGNAYDFLLAVGDDVTDEDMFYRLALDKRSFTIKVGNAKSFAKYNLHTPHMVRSLLEMMSHAKN